MSSNTSSTTFKVYGLDQATCLSSSISSSVKWRYDWSYISLTELLWAVNECKLLRTVYRKHSIFAGCYQRTKPQKSTYIVRNLLSLVAQELKPSLRKGYLWDQSFESLANWFIDDYMGNWEWRLVSQYILTVNTSTASAWGPLPWVSIITIHLLTATPLRDVDPPLPPRPHIYPWMWCQDWPLGAELALVPSLIVSTVSGDTVILWELRPQGFPFLSASSWWQLCIWWLSCVMGAWLPPSSASFNPLGRYNLPPCSTNFMSPRKGTIVRALSRLGMIFFFQSRLERLKALAMGDGNPSHVKGL